MVGSSRLGSDAISKNKARSGDQPGMMHAAAGKCLGQLQLGGLVADEGGRLARVQETLEPIGLGQRLVFLLCRRAGHQGAPEFWVSTRTPNFFVTAARTSS